MVAELEDVGDQLVGAFQNPGLLIGIPLALLGAIFMIWSDTAARSLFAPRELPVGIITALIGAPIFILVLVRYRRMT